MHQNNSRDRRIVTVPIPARRTRGRLAPVLVWHRDGRLAVVVCGIVAAVAIAAGTLAALLALWGVL